MTKSNWEYTKQTSQYHFDNDRYDQPGEWYRPLGQVKNTWSQELESLKTIVRPLTWENRKYTMGQGHVSPMLAQEEYDIIQGQDEDRDIEDNERGMRYEDYGNIGTQVAEETY